jgi:hypothetical protein
MPRISIFVPAGDLAIIDSVAASDRSHFIAAAARDAAMRVRRNRIDEEIESIMRATADHDVALAAEFACTLVDGS